MDADRVRSYLQVACAGLGFDIGEVWWMSNENGTSTVAAIEDNRGHESDSSGEGYTYAGGIRSNKKNKPPKKRFLQLYTSKSYGDQRSKLVQPHDNDDNSNDNGDSKQPSTTPPTSPSSSRQLIRRNSSTATLELDEEHVLSPRIVEAVTHTTQVVWANCEKTQGRGLLGRSDIKLQTAIGMPVGVDESGNVWVVVMFSPKNVESSSDAIDYLQYISRSAASTSIPCLLPVVGDAPSTATTMGTTTGGTKMICNGEEGDNHNRKAEDHHSLVSIKPNRKQPDHTEELGDGVTAKFVSFNINDDDEKSPGNGAGSSSSQYNDNSARRLSENDLRNAPKDDWGIPMLPETAELSRQSVSSIANSQSTDMIGTAINDAFDEASYGVWSTIMNSAGGDTIRTSESIANKMHLIQERLEEFATAFLGMSVFDVADAWTVSSNSLNGGASNPVLKCLFTVGATDTNPGINALREISGNASINVGDGAVGKAYSSGYPVWSSVKEHIYDSSRKQILESCKIETAFAVPIFSSGDVTPSCVLSCYSLLPAESVPFVLNFVQKAVRLLWSGLDQIVNPHESVGKKLWKDVGPADLGEMAADVEMQKAFIGKKRPRGQSFIGDEAREDGGRDRSSSLAGLPSLAPSPFIPVEQAMDLPIDTPPAKGLPAPPMFPNTVVEPNPYPQQFSFLDSGDAGHWAVQQAVQSVGQTVGDVQLWNDGANNTAGIVNNIESQPGNQFDNSMSTHQQYQPQQQQSIYQQQNVQDQVQMQQQPLHQPLYQQFDPQQQQYQQQPPQQAQNQQFQMSYINYQPNTNGINGQQQQQQQNLSPQIAEYPPPGVHTDDPAVIHANLMEFNAMAQMHNTNNANNQPSTSMIQPAAAPGMLASAPAPLNSNNGLINTGFQVNQSPMMGMNHIKLDSMRVIPISQAEGSVILTGQNMYCTSTAQPVDPQLMTGMFEDTKPCRIEGCNDLTVPKRPYCAKHCGNRQCEKEGCKKCAQGATRFCIAHGGGRRCTFPGCDKGARDKFFCAAHGGGKRCKKEGCNKSAVGGSQFCTGHGGGKRCQVPGCDKSAQSSTKFCVKHGGGKKCQHPGCEKVSRGRTLYCAAHGGGVRCKLEGCNRVAIGKAQLCRAHGGGSSRSK